MITEQLISYIKQQLERGVSEEAIKSELLKVGWAEADFLEAMKEIKPPSEEGKKPESLEGKPENLVDLSQESMPGFLDEKKSETAVGGQSESEKNKQGNQGVNELIDVSNLGGEEAKLKEINLEESTSSSQSSLPEEAAKEEFSDGKQATEGAKLSFNRFAPKFVLGVLGLLVLAGLGVGGFFYTKNSELGLKMSSLLKEKESLITQINQLSQEKSNLEKQIQILQESNKALEDQLSIFTIPSNSESENLPLTVRGVLRLVKDQFTLTTDRSIIIYVKNSKDAKVKSALEPFVETIVELSGTHVPGSPNMVVLSINGKPIEEKQQ